jgi:hypothetical protein
VPFLTCSRLAEGAASGAKDEDDVVGDDCPNVGSVPSRPDRSRAMKDVGGYQNLRFILLLSSHLQLKDPRKKNQNPKLKIQSSKFRAQNSMPLLNFEL